MKKQEIEIINPDEFGIEKTKAKELYGNLPQLKVERDELEKQFNEVIKMDIESPETWKQARELRLLIQKNRTQGINVWHKTTKDFFLKGGQFVDAIKRKEIAINERMERDLEEIEKYEEIQRQKRLAEIQEKRVAKLLPYLENASEINLSEMEEDVWLAYLSAKKKAYDDEQEAISKAEEERIAKEKAEAEERERIKAENKRLKKEAEERERLAKIEAEKRAKEEAERLKKEESERKSREEKERKEREAYEAKLRAEREAKEKIEREERVKREKLEAELRAKEEAERKAKEAEEASLQAELNKGDADKVKDLINDLQGLKTKYTFKSTKNKKMYSGVNELIDKVIGYINR